MTEFSKFNLKKEILDALVEMKFDHPTEVQEKSIPIILEGKDVIVRSKTGTGKTAAFAVPIVNMLKSNERGVRVLIIAPTRELALQIDAFIKGLVKFHSIRTVVVYGGVSTRPQSDMIRDGANIVVGTPGRILDLIERNILDLKNVKHMVLDEADIMLDMGFIDDVERIMEYTPKERQTLLFSATVDDRLRHISRNYMKNATNISFGGQDEMAVNMIENIFTLSSNSYKFSVLLAYLDEYKPDKSIIFTRTQRSAEIVFRMLKDQGYTPVVIHGRITQARREMAMNHFRKAEKGMLIATNIAARGIDISNITDVINFDAPDDPTVYIHRVGRSARMGKNGRAFTIFGFDQEGLIEAIERQTKTRFKKINVNSKKFGEINFSKYIGGSSFGGGPKRFGENRERGKFGNRHFNNKRRSGRGGGEFRPRGY